MGPNLEYNFQLENLFKKQKVWKMFKIPTLDIPICLETVNYRDIPFVGLFVLTV